MKNKLFDVLITYTDSIASSAVSDELMPFSIASERSHYNRAYGYFLEECSKKGLTAAFTTTSEIVDKQNFKSYWTFEKKNWIKNTNLCTSKFIFDKFSPVSEIQQERRNDLFSDSVVKPFNDAGLFALFFDKHNTYSKLTEFAIPTVKINNNNIEKAVTKLKKLVAEHPHSNDFAEKIVMKDRYGAGGIQIYGISNKNTAQKIAAILEENQDIDFVIQPFTKFFNGYSYKEHSGYIDIRIIYLDGKAIQTYIRVAKENDFRCNEHQGGAVEYISLDELPKDVIDLSDRIAGIIDKPQSFYALDFIVSTNGNIYLIEGNSGPGIYWGIGSKQDELNTKWLIRRVTDSIVSKVGRN